MLGCEAATRDLGRQHASWAPDEVAVLARGRADLVVALDARSWSIL
jgi:hypothetical protein